MTDEPKHFDVRDSDDFSLTDWTSDFRVLIRGFDRVFIAEAKLAAERATSASRRGDVPGIAGAAAAAILLAAAACEARLSEYVGEHAKTVGEKAIKAIREQPDALKQWRILLSRLAPSYVLDGSAPVACLFKLRDLAAHRHARYLPPGEWPEKLKDCVAKDAIPVTKSKEIDWTSGVYQQHVAIWAYETAANWLATVHALGVTASAS